MLRDSTHGRGDFRRVGGERGDDAEHGLGKAQALTHPLEPGYQDHAGQQADGGASQKGRNGQRCRHLRAATFLSPLVRGWPR